MVQIELFGCTSAGKTTLSRQVALACKQEGINLVLHDDFLLKQLRLNWIRSKIIRVFIIDIYCMIACLLTTRKHFELYQFCLKIVMKLPVPWLTKVNLLRNINKGIGTYEVIKSKSRSNQVVLVDGGTLQAVQPLFVHNNHQLDENAVIAFSKLVSLPDIAIHVEQPVYILKERIKKRGHKRISTESEDTIVEFAERAVNSYRLLIQNIVKEGWMSNINAQNNILTSNPSGRDEVLLNQVLKIISSKLYKPLEPNSSDSLSQTTKHQESLYHYQSG
jgi:thymidylate kinase